MGKRVLLTGCNGGMGRATALRLIAEGYEVYGLDLKESSYVEGLHFFSCDLTCLQSIEDVYAKLQAEGIRFDAIIHQAGIYDLASLIEMGEAEFTRIFDINVFAVYRLNKVFLPLLSPGGKILITSSELAPLDPLPFTGIYAVTKSAIEKYAYSLRMELQLLGYHVVVIRPGAVATSMISVSTEKLDRFIETSTHYQTNAARFRDVVNKVEAKKIPPEKIGALIAKILSKKKPKYTYSINRNAGLLLLNALPRRIQNWMIKKILKD